MKTAALIVSLFSIPVAAQQPRILNATTETHAAVNLDREFQSLVSAQVAPAWIGYAAPIVAGEHNMCCFGSWNCCAGCALEGEAAAKRSTPSPAAPVQLEGPSHFVVLFRAEQKTVGKIRRFSLDCELDAGGLTVHWLTGVRPADSLSLLASFVATAADAPRERSRIRDAALGAIALHADPAADRTLEQFVAAGQPESLRQQAAFWLGSARGQRGYEILSRLVREDLSDRVREKAVFALSVSKEPAAVDAIIAVARHDKSPRVRGQALFWLAQKAGLKAAPTITDAIANDPDADVKKRAVFALSRLPKEEGVRLLIEVARTNRSPVVRKQAIFWLGQSRDPRALDFLEEILRK